MYLVCRKTCRNPPEIHDMFAKFLNSQYCIIKFLAIIYGMADSEKSLLKELPGEVKDIDDINRVKKDFQNKLKKEGSGFFAGIRKWNYKRQINKFEDNKDNPFHAGAKGENKVIEELEKLNDSYHVMCGVKLKLPYYVKYKGKKNLK